ncbi:HNH endonuclease [Streptomyces tanashiensis]|uniref:HNH endonuclease n=1 Tax=Streptomyces tanashiensis TaxID=67367 RepID=UPI003683A685
MGTQLRVGEILRSARNRDPSAVLIDGCPNLHHRTASATLAQVQLSKGINPMAKVRAPDGPRRPAILIRSSPWKAGTAETPWHDVFDLDNGRIRYFGDHRSDHTVPVGTTQGNALLLEALAAHRGTTAEQRALAVPLLVFATVTHNKSQKGYVQFCGLAVIESAERIEQEAEEGLFPNYRYELSVVDLKAEDDQVDWSWIEARGNPELATADALARAPRGWRRWVEQGHDALPELRHEAARPAQDRAPGRLAGRTMPAGSPAELTVGMLMHRLRNLRTHTRNGRQSRHKPLALLWGISRGATGKPHTAPWRQFREEVGGLLAEFGHPDSSVTPEYPFWHLQTSELWDVRGLPSEQAAAAHAATFDRLNSEGGVTEQAERLLRDPLVRSEAMAVLRETYLADVDHHALMERLGLAGHASASGIEDVTEGPAGETGPAARRTRTSSTTIRDTALTARLKKLHGDSCQICGLRLPTRFGTYSEAAHIRGLGRPHNGPDEQSNLLVLCPNHHVQFDTLAIYVDTEGTVRSTADGSAVGPLHRHPAHRISETHLRYHRALCGRDTPDRSTKPTSS